MIEVDGEHSDLCEVVKETLSAEGVTTGRVDMLFLDSVEMTSLNVEHMGGSGPTDVLAFPIDGIDSDETEPHIGDIVICTEVAKAQAADHMGDEQAELKLLAIHAALHLCGYDHHDLNERAEMWEREATNLQRYGLIHPGDQQ